MGQKILVSGRTPRQPQLRRQSFGIPLDHRDIGDILNHALLVHLRRNAVAYAVARAGEGDKIAGLGGVDKDLRRYRHLFAAAFYES